MYYRRTPKLPRTSISLSRESLKVYFVCTEELDDDELLRRTGFDAETFNEAVQQLVEQGFLFASQAATAKLWGEDGLESFETGFEPLERYESKTRVVDVFDPQVTLQQAREALLRSLKNHLSEPQAASFIAQLESAETYEGLEQVARGLLDALKQAGHKEARIAFLATIRNRFG